MNFSPSELDRSFLNISSKLTEPFCDCWNLLRYRLAMPLDPTKFENCSTKTKEIALRSMIVLGALTSCALTCAYPLSMLGGLALIGASTKITRALGYFFQKNGYTHVLGEAREKTIEDSKIKVMTWNICGLGGGFSLDHGGLIHWRSRLDEIVNTIRSENPDVLLFQEIVDGDLAEGLIAKLKSEYAHFYIHIGPNVMGIESGCVVISKCAVHNFSFESFSTNEWDQNRGFTTIELKKRPEDAHPGIRVIGTHLSYGNSPASHENRVAQVAQIIHSIAKKTLALPTVVAGDFNIERDQEAGIFLEKHFRHGYTGPDYTCTNKLTSEWDGNNNPEEIIDYISVVKDGTEVPFENVHLVKAFEEDYNTQTARSDHHGLAAEIII